MHYPPTISELSYLEVAKIVPMLPKGEHVLKLWWDLNPIMDNYYKLQVLIAKGLEARGLPPYVGEDIEHPQDIDKHIARAPDATEAPELNEDYIEDIEEEEALEDWELEGEDWKDS